MKEYHDPVTFLWDQGWYGRAILITNCFTILGIGFLIWLPIYDWIKGTFK